MEEVIITAAVAAGGYVGTKLFGTALATMGDDINKLYVKGRDKIVEVATKKVDNPDDGKKVNLRAARVGRTRLQSAANSIESCITTFHCVKGRV